MNPIRSGRLQVCVSVLLTLCVLVIVYLMIDWPSMIRLLRGVSRGWVSTAFAFFVLGHVLRVIRFRVVMPDPLLSFNRLLGVTFLHGMYNYLLPARMGELSFPFLLARRGNVTLASSAAALLICRFYDFFVIALILPIVLAIFRSQFPAWLHAISLVSCVLIYLVAGGVYVIQHTAMIGGWLERAALRFHAGRLGWPLHSMSQLVAALRQCRSLLIHTRLLLLTVGIWLCVYTNLYFVIVALGHSLSYSEVIVLSLIMVPLTLLPLQGIGGLGTHEAGWVAALAFFSRPASTALELAVGSHVLLLAYVLILGLLGLLVLNLDSALITGLRRMHEE
jgi:glycosyltransferase 2 family protein